MTVKTCQKIIFLIHLITFSYFIQGGGSNQSATILEIRSFVEKGRFNFDEYKELTGDRSYYKDKIFSNKSPHITFFVSPFYYLFFSFSDMLGFDTQSDEYNFLAIHFITILGASLWGALTGFIIFYILGELFAGLTAKDKLLLSLMFPLATQIFPYSTMLFAHAFESSWVSMTTYLYILLMKNFNQKNLFKFSLSYGATLLASQLFVLTAPLIYISIFIKSKKMLRDIICFSLLTLIPLIPLFIYNTINFDYPWVTNRKYEDIAFRNPKLFMGVFWIPRPGRILKTLFWSYRSLPPTQTFLLLFIPGLFMIIKKRLFSKFIIAYTVNCVLIYMVFLTSYTGWHGGVAFGPRYITLILPVFFLWSIPIFLRFRKVYFLLMGLSIPIMLIVTSVDPLWCGSEKYGKPFLHCSMPNFLDGSLALNNDKLFIFKEFSDHSFNFGHIIGLEGVFSLIPLLLVQLTLFGIMVKFWSCSLSSPNNRQ